ncbi:MAG TPA: hypothetical protein DIT65_02230 [Cryomorphaceae bacterium]|nr:hypothetical protein [Cryomorphaceae bacterium]
MMRYKYHNNQYLPYNELVSSYNWNIIGYSSEERPIVSTVIGEGTRDICIWAGMHGNEITGIHIILQLIDMLQSKYIELEDFKLHIIPVINPDAYVRYTRRNGMGIDLNRDFKSFQTIESAKLIGWLRMINPELCFNLHDQRTIFHVNGESAFTSLLVPSSDISREITPLRRRVMNRLGNALISINHDLSGVGRYTDEFYPTAVGDYLMSQNIPNILIESGVARGDLDRKAAREFGVQIITHTLTASEESVNTYDELPVNEQGQLEWVFTNVLYAHMRVDVAVKRILAMNGHNKAVIYTVDDLGDLSARPRLYEIDGSNIVLTEALNVDRPITADFGTIVFEDGIIVSGQLKEKAH